MTHSRRLLTPILSACCLLLAHAAALAQVGPALWIVPFGEKEQFQAEAQVTFFFDGSSNGPGSPDATLLIADGRGRVRFAQETEHPVHLGADVFFLNIDSSDPALPNQLVNVQFAGATSIASWDDWSIAVIIGFGSSSSEPFSDGRSWYARGDLIATWKLDEKSFLQFMLNYHGNRTIFPDVPLPLISYTRQSSATLRYTIGVPVSAISWQPGDHWLLELTYVIPFSIDFTISYEVTEGVTLYASYKEVYEAFHLKGDQKDRRLFFEQSRIEAGVRWKPISNLQVILAGGYAFGQEISRGFDARNTTTVRDLSDEPFLRAGVEFRY
ncbi:MAG: hypothetical protein WD768_06065 [Phycisphaeraceae bacterium]